MEDKFLLSDSILSRTSLCSYFVSWKIDFFTSNKIAFISCTEIIIPFCKIFLQLWHKKDVFFGINFCYVRILWKKCGIYFCCPNVFNNFFSTKSKGEDTIYMGIIYMPFLSRNLLCKNIYTMSSFMWSNELFSILKWWLYLYCIFYLVFEHMKSVTQKI